MVKKFKLVTKTKFLLTFAEEGTGLPLLLGMGSDKNENAKKSLAFFKFESKANVGDIVEVDVEVSETSGRYFVAENDGYLTAKQKYKKFLLDELRLDKQLEAGG